MLDLLSAAAISIPETILSWEDVMHSEAVRTIK